jgi:hypothetical protein
LLVSRKIETLAQSNVNETETVQYGDELSLRESAGHNLGYSGVTVCGTRKEN